MRVGGRVEWLLEPSTPEELRAAWIRAREGGSAPRVLGGGANLIVDDGLLPGVVIATDRLRRVFRPSAERPGDEALDQDLPPAEMAPRAPAEDPRLVAWAGATLPALVRAARDLGLAGLEGLVGVPGHLGGAIAMNAGGQLGDVWDVVETVRVLEPDGTLRDLARADCAPRYRDGGLAGRVVLGAVLRLRPDSRAAIEERMRAFLTRKRALQPVTEWSSGCIFQNPDPERSEGRSAGQLVEQCGGKLLARGDAVVSPKHANFIVNRGRASAADVLGLIEDARRLVLDQTGIHLELEVKRWPVGPPCVAPALD